jgi:hypothetical protein
MKTRIALTLIALSTFSSIAMSQVAPPIPSGFDEAGKFVGKAGTLNADGSYRINLPRTDVVFHNSSGMIIPPDLGLVTYIAFSNPTQSSFAVGDIAMLEGEIDMVVDTLRAGKFEVVSLHNHMSAEEPRLFYVHFQQKGSVTEMAKSFKRVVAVLGHGEKRKIAKNVGKPKLDQEALSSIFGSKPQVFPSGVIRFANPRKDISVTVGDDKFLPGMGLGSWAAFTACECGLTMVMGDTACTKSDLQGAIDTFRKAGIHITSIHHHLLGGSVETAFMHYEGEGDSLKLAAGIKDCWKLLVKPN